MNIDIDELPASNGLDETEAKMLADMRSRKQREAACTQEVTAALQEIMARHDCQLDIVTVDSTIQGRRVELRFVAR